MKLKFRADKKDVVAFLWACLLLLVVSALFVRNLYHVTNSTIAASEAETLGWTWNFVPGFFPPYLKYTLLFWIAAVIILTVSLSSHFFERDKLYKRPDGDHGGSLFT